MWKRNTGSNDRLSNKVLRKIKFYYGLLTSNHRGLPDFLLIGGQRCGTTSFYKDICEHPNIVAAIKKEVHFFDGNFNKGEKWYKAHFASRLYKNRLLTTNQKNILIGESTPYYLFHPNVPERVCDLIPDVKIIVMLRNPVERAYSHYHHAVNKGRELLSFEKAIEREFNVIQKNGLDSFEFSEDGFNYKWHSYVSRGIYIRQLKRWFKFFPKNKIMIIKSEEYFADPGSTISVLYNFLDLPGHQIDRHNILNIGEYKNIDVKVESKLSYFYEPYNEELYRLLNVNFDW